MRDLDEIIIHCSATPPHMDVGAETIRQWHIEDNGFFDIGYHFVIRRNGKIENGRPIEKVGAHAKGHNTSSIGVCMIGGDDGNKNPENNFTNEQWLSLYNLLSDLKEKYTIDKISGHNEYSNKACPSFDVQDWRQTVGI